jgi:hypothetical protein
MGLYSCCKCHGEKYLHIRETSTLKKNKMKLVFWFSLKKRNKCNMSSRLVWMFCRSFFETIFGGIRDCRGRSLKCETERSFSLLERYEHAKCNYWKVVQSIKTVHTNYFELDSIVICVIGSWLLITIGRSAMSRDKQIE